MPIVSSFAEILASLAPLMTAPTFQNFSVIAAGWIFTNGRHSVTEIRVLRFSSGPSPPGARTKLQRPETLAARHGDGGRTDRE